MKRDLPTLALYEQVKEFISRKIQDGTWKSGDRLPSENDLVVQFGMSRMTVNRALRELVEQGRIKLDREVPLPHPRHYSVKTTAAFAELKAELTESVRVEVLAAQAAMA